MKIIPRNHAPEDIFLMLPEAIFNMMKDKNPRAIPLAIEKVKGIITIIIKAGSKSIILDQFNFSIPLSIKIDT